MHSSNKILEYILKQEIDFEHFFHPPAATCLASAQLRGTDLSIGGKTMLLKAKNSYYLICLPAHYQAENKKIRAAIGTNRIRFAEPSELEVVLAYPSGAIPPLGRPFHSIDLLLDERVLHNDYIAFNIGTLTESIKIKIQDYRRMTEFRIVDVAKTT